MIAERFVEHPIPTAVYSVAALTILVWVTYKKSSAPRYPPGPARSLPWVGSLAYMPKHKGWETYERWGKEYNSDILHLQGAGLNIIVLNKIEAAMDLLDKRSAIYSNRAPFSIVELTGWHWLMSSMLYGPAWRERRKLLQKHLHPSKPEVFQLKFLTSIREEIIPNLFENPGNWINIFRHAIGSTTISLAYGIPQQGSRLPDGTDNDLDDDPRSLNSLINLGEAAVNMLNETYAGGAIIVDLIPILKYFPSWFPGLGFKAKIPEWRRLTTQFRELPFDVGRSLIGEGKAEESFVSLCLDEGENLEAVKDTAGMIYAGTVDTTLALLHNFIYSMLFHPEVQARVQKELDQLLTTERRSLPEWYDRDRLPYLFATVKEIVRWRPVTPLGAPHVVDKDDEYKGYHIPKDSLIIANIWLMLHNQETYGQSPDKFRPERFLDEKGQLKGSMADPADVAFGFGRRVCPGAHMAIYNLFMVVSHVLSVFNIEYAVDDNGVVNVPSMDWPDLVVCPPLPFDCKFVPRAKLRK